jgi:thiosulfate dehydrogenase
MLEVQISRCIENGLHGKPLLWDSKAMVALVTYLHWISTGVPIYRDVPVSRAADAQADAKPDVAAGQRPYASDCAVCHGDKGQKVSAPALWGPRSFSASSDLANQAMLTVFIKGNMPPANPNLTDQQAAEVAALVLSKPRPK